MLLWFLHRQRYSYRHTQMYIVLPDIRTHCIRLICYLGCTISREVEYRAHIHPKVYGTIYDNGEMGRAAVHQSIHSKIDRS
jgi:hypothetical protein